jgi:hypothetical protein
MMATRMVTVAATAQQIAKFAIKSLLDAETGTLTQEKNATSKH